MAKHIAEYFKNRINLWLLPLLLLATSGSVLIECYAPEMHDLMTAAFFLYSLLIFMLLDRLYRIRIFGALLYVVIFILVLILSMRSVFMAEYRGGAPIGFQQWFYGSFSSEQPVVVPYFAAMFFAGGLFMASVMFYFTQIQYRAVGTLLMIFIPFVIYAKRDDTISDLTVTLMITLFIAIIVHNRIFLSSDSGRGTLVNTGYVLSVALFVSVTGALAMIFPDLSTPSRLETDSSFLNFSNYGNAGGMSLTNPDSSTRFHGAEYTNEPVFYVYPDDMTNIEYPIYFRRRSMNAYDAQSLDWYVSSDLKQTSTLAETESVSFPRLYEAMEYSGKAGLLGIPANCFENNSVSYDTYGFEIEFSENLGTVAYVPAPYYSSIENTWETAAGMANSDMYYLYPQRSASDFGRIRQEAVLNQSKAEEFAKKAGGSTEDFLRDIEKAGSADVNDVVDSEGNPLQGKSFEYHIGRFYEAYYSLIDSFYNYPPSYLEQNGLKDYDRIKELADEIVKDCTSDYEKAKAIEQYFTDAGFTYDLEYIPSDESVSYFLFESRTGICIDFASAMGVMCIMEGLPVRYVEGFAAYERDAEDSSRLVVRDSHAHAFIEVFIPYVGWLTFDPTVSGYMRDFSQTEEQESGFLTVFLAYIGRILLVLGVLFVLIFIVFLDRIWEFFFRLTLRFYEPDKKLTRLYRHIFKLLEFEDKTDLSPYTARLLNGYIRKKTGESLTEVTALFEANRFGSRPVTEEQFDKAYEAYKLLYPRIRKKMPVLEARGKS